MITPVTRRPHIAIVCGSLCAASLVACSRSSPARDTGTHDTTAQSTGAPSASARDSIPPGIVRIDPRDTAAYSSAGPQAVAAVAKCKPPACRPDIFRGPGNGELTVGLDSGRADEQQWHTPAETPPPGGSAYQDSSWRAILTKWERQKPQRLLLVDTVPRTYAYVRDHVSMASVWGLQILPPDKAEALSSNPAAANGAYLIITKGHVPHTTPRLNARP
jgi:hypothetical protein